MSRAALVVIVFLDLFILTSIFDGLADHTAQLAGPGQRVPPLCRRLVIDGEWNPTNRLDSLARMVAGYQANPYEEMARVDRRLQHPLCASIVGTYESIRGDSGLARNLQESRRLRKETQDLRAELERMEGAYDTATGSGPVQCSFPVPLDGAPVPDLDNKDDEVPVFPYLYRPIMQAPLSPIPDGLIYPSPHSLLSGVFSWKLLRIR